MMRFCHHSWFWGTWSILLASTVQYAIAAKTSVLETFSATCQLCLVSSADGFSLSELSLLLIHVSYVDVFYHLYLLLLGSLVAAMFTNGDSTNGVCNSTTLQCIPLPGKCASWWWSMAHTRSTLSGCSPTVWVGELCATHSAVPSHFINKAGHTGEGAQQRITQFCHLPFMMARRGLLFQ